MEAAKVVVSHTVTTRLHFLCCQSTTRPSYHPPPAPPPYTPHPPKYPHWALLGGGSASMNAYCIHSPEILQRPQISSFKTRNIPHTTEDKLQREILDCIKDSFFLNMKNRQKTATTIVQHSSMIRINLNIAKSITRFLTLHICHLFIIIVLFVIIC